MMMVLFGLNALASLPSLGTEEQAEIFDETTQTYIYTDGDNSMLILLWGIVTIFLILGFVVVWRANMKSAYKAQLRKERGQHIPTFIEEMRTYADTCLNKTLLFLPVMGVLIFTIMPLIFMISMAFTNYDRDHQPPENYLIGLDYKTLEQFWTLQEILVEHSGQYWDGRLYGQSLLHS